MRYLFVCLAVVSHLFLPLSAHAQNEFTLTVTPSARTVEVGDKVTVHATITRNGEPARLGIAVFTLHIETAPDLLQSESAPIFLPARPEPAQFGTFASEGTFVVQAARSGRVSFVVHAHGEVHEIDDEGNPVFYFTTVTGRSASIVVREQVTDPVRSTPVTVPEPLTVTLFGLGLAGLAARRYRRSL